MTYFSGLDAIEGFIDNNGNCTIPSNGMHRSLLFYMLMKNEGYFVINSSGNSSLTGSHDEVMNYFNYIIKDNNLANRALYVINNLKKRRESIFINTKHIENLEELAKKYNLKNER